MKYRVTYLQACEPQEILGEHDGITVEIDTWQDEMGLPRVTVSCDDRPTLIDFVRHIWGDDDDLWFTEWVLNRIEDTTATTEQVTTHLTNTDLADAADALELLNGIDEGENTNAERLEELIRRLRAQAGNATGEGIALGWPSR